MKKKKMKCKTYLRKSEEKGEFRTPRNEFLYFKKGTPIMLGDDRRCS
jgi:tRNA G37 N-methylase Trm5